MFTKAIKPMNTIECIKTRRSIRRFLPQKVTHEVVEQLIDCARWAPSWNNCKAVRYTVLEKEEHLQLLANTLMAPENVHIVKNAPLVLVISNVKKRSGYERDGHVASAKGDSWEMFDAGAACQTLCLAAAEFGLGTVIMGTFDEDGISSYIGLPEDEKIIALVACGYPLEVPKPPRRKEVSEILRYF
ncbi:nitroreductase family protein [Anaerotignum sp.]|uniref:nitroreductase family protein n=1 Tax=Anaerotignum sp. TaxID=2039241 RepID=UPI00332C8771